MGVAVIVACLPPLRPLLHGVSFESVIRSLRSKVSLHSLRNRNSREGKKAGSLSNASVVAFAGLASSAGHDGRNGNGDADVQTYIMSDMKHGQATPENTSGGIQINEQIRHSVQVV